MIRDSLQAVPDQANQDLTYMPMDVSTAREIADDWKYPEPYDFYDMTADPEDYQEFVTPELWPEFFLQVRQEGQLIGFLSGSVVEGGGGVEIGLGMRPDLTGRGLGRNLMRCNLEWIHQECPGVEIRLSIASFNQRGIKVYEASGFKVIRHFTQVTNGGEYDFVEMKLVG
ncbi:GNAT family N-acetyltransferase [Cutibacterium avidum]|uniref:GNAT family N-acetyltransferase n=1 Tax=Cutibacterium avidum TaxID=33010 RepID=UPI000764325F|nr:GNAT family N-acetyltransferase [Cutibacterium avidum]KXA68031.1 acetyltransferase, GNAT family [Cutibacterium avidum]MCO6631947.1 GNAT family N-acetyltransferase [Cutibacterium avidum]MCO6664254.1 GNAT family N-acetyltransferase [Cutibacterium avidum]MCO6678942.1 GNAT family N-acetyltransferase [Cutibacterium avidum]MCT1416706.1 GNAT family N-acetyltransferase [Cutibacterium avidum]